MSGRPIISAQNLQLRFDTPLDVEDIPEFHAARLLVLLRITGQGNTCIIRGRTKLVKLDFFVRYPQFLSAALKRLASQGRAVPAYDAGSEAVEASMIRYRFGPWDPRYYNLISYLQGRDLIRVGGGAGSTETYSLTPLGKSLADEISADDPYRPLVERCLVVKSSLSSYTGTELKDFIYDTFIDEVAALRWGAIIEPPQQSRRPT